MVTVFACLAVALLLGVFALAAGLGAAVLARQRAENGADLAALAGAARVLDGVDRACAAAADIAGANGSTLRSCEVIGLDVRIVVEVDARAGPIRTTVTARARAGPVQDRSDGATP